MVRGRLLDFKGIAAPPERLEDMVTEPEAGHRLVGIRDPARRPAAVWRACVEVLLPPFGSEAQDQAIEGCSFPFKSLHPLEIGQPAEGGGDLGGKVHASAARCRRKASRGPEPRDQPAHW